MSTDHTTSTQTSTHATEPHADTVELVVEAWERQQDAYVNRREDRFTTMLEVLARTHPEGPRRILDLAGGCGSIAARALRRFPSTQVVVADKDPVLLELARRTVGEDDRVEVADVDLDRPDWIESVDGPFDAVLSSTALHWLPPYTLARVYADLQAVTVPGSVVMNADHLQYDDASQPTLAAVAEADDERTRAEGIAAGALDWDGWWARAEGLDGLGDAARRRAEVWAGKNGPNPRSPLEFHLTALHAGGWSETGVVWRYLDDVIVFGRR